MGDLVINAALIALGVTSLIMAALVGHPPLHRRARRR
jgi:hypothetical protein